MQSLFIDNLPSQEDVLKLFLYQNFIDFCNGKQSTTAFCQNLHKVLVNLLKISKKNSNIFEMSREILVISPEFITTFQIDPKKFLLSSYVEIIKQTPFEKSFLKIKKEKSINLFDQITRII